MAPGLNSRARASAVLPRSATRALSAALVRQIQQNAREGDIVLHDQQHRIAGPNQIAVVVDLDVVHHRRRGAERRRQE